MTNPKFEAAEQAKKAYEDALEAITVDDIHGLFQTYFEKYPELKALYWTQETPTFNDGSPCRFRMDEIQAILAIGKNKDRIAGMSEDAIQDLNKKQLWGLVPNYEELDAELPAFNRALGEMSDLIPKHIAEAVLGDGWLILVTPNKMTKARF